MTSSRNEVAVAIDGHVARLSFSRPPHNHVSASLLRELTHAHDAADADPAVRAVVLASDGAVFCAGADLGNPGEPVDDAWIADLYVQAVRRSSPRSRVRRSAPGWGWPSRPIFAWRHPKRGSRPISSSSAFTPASG